MCDAFVNRASIMHVFVLYMCVYKCVIKCTCNFFMPLYTLQAFMIWGAINNLLFCYTSLILGCLLFI